MKKKYLIIIIVCLLVAVAGIVTANILIKPKEEKTPTENKVDVINKTSVLETADSAKAAELIKENIVKITNEVKGVKVTGTGFFHESGYLVTNSHVVDLKGTIKVTYNDGTVVDATLVSNDMTSDIAILSVEKQKVLALTFGNTLNLKVTDELYAIGYPFALEGEATTTKGILSARRSAGGIEYLQTDMSLNTGNSGGPLINAKAEVFGMTTYATENASLGMSISAESLESIIQKLIDKKETKYLEDDRETNALSTVLKEIGHEDEDIYDEKERLDEVFEREQPKEEVNEEIKEEPKQETKPVVKKSSETRLSKLTVNGVTIPVEDIREHWYPFYIRRQRVEKLDIVAVPKDSKAKVAIKNNGAFEMGTARFVNIIVTAENGTQYEYSLFVTVTKPTVESAVKYSVSTGFIHNSELNSYGIALGVSAIDKYENLAEEEYADPYLSASMTLYLKTTGENKKLKTYNYTFKYPHFNNSNMFVKESEIQSFLTDEDYILNNGTEVEIEVHSTLVTVSQGTYTSIDTITIKK